MNLRLTSGIACAVVAMAAFIVLMNWRASELGYIWLPALFIGTVGFGMVAMKLIRATELIECLRSSWSSRAPARTHAYDPIDDFSDSDPEKRERALRLTHVYHGDDATEAVITLLGDTHWQVRRAAAQELWRLRDARAVDPLITLLNDPHEDVRAAAIESLHHFDDTRVIPPIVQSLQDPSPWVRISALDALRFVNLWADFDPLDLIARRLDDADTSLRATAARALVDLRDDRAVPLLLARLHDDNPTLRGHVVSALGGSRNPAVVDPLISRLQDDDSSVRQAAAASLSRLGDQRAVPALVERLKDDNPLVREAAESSLSALRPDRDDWPA